MVYSVTHLSVVFSLSLSNNTVLEAKGKKKFLI